MWKFVRLERSGVILKVISVRDECSFESSLLLRMWSLVLGVETV